MVRKNLFILRLMVYPYYTKGGRSDILLSCNYCILVNDVRKLVLGNLRQMLQLILVCGAFLFLKSVVVKCGKRLVMVLQIKH